MHFDRDYENMNFHRKEEYDLHPNSKSHLAKRYFFSRGELASDDYQQFWIRYKPGRILRKKLSRLPSMWIQIVLAVFLLVAVAVGSCTSLAVAILVLMAAAALALILVLTVSIRQLLMPTHISLDEGGIGLHWLRRFCNIKGPYLTWERISHVSIDKKSESDTKLEFNIIARMLPWSDRLVFMMLAPEMSKGWHTVGCDRATLDMDLDGIASSDDRKRLQIGLTRFLPSYRIEPTVSDELNLSLKVETYTDIWFDALSQSTARLRDGELSDDTFVCDKKYKIERTIGAGGQATAYEASVAHVSDKFRVVLKEFVLPAQAGIKVRKRVLENIQKEATLLKKLTHPNIVKLLDFFVEDQRAYLVLEHINGVTLKQRIEDGGALTDAQAAPLAITMCQILEYLHSSKPPVVHRDFTPDNLMLVGGTSIKLIDFNVAQQLEANSTKTVVGKHAYIPPEQFRGQATEQSDIYALGATLAFLLTGVEPTPILQSHPQKINAGVSSELNAIVAKATTLEASGRYANAAEMREDLEKLLKS